MKKLMNRVMLLGLLAVLAAPLAGCNTVEGMGQDIEKMGDSISDGAK